MTTTPLLLSLRPYFADLVFSGLKRAELRRRFARYAEDRNVFVYVTNPEKVLRGGFRVDHVWKGTPEDIWDEVSMLAGIGRPDFDAYYSGSTVAYALRIAHVWEFESPISLRRLKDQIGSFTVPQSWRYLKESEMRYLQKMRRDTRIVPLDMEIEELKSEKATTASLGKVNFANQAT